MCVFLFVKKKKKGWVWVVHQLGVVVVFCVSNRVVLNVNILRILIILYVMRDCEELFNEFQRRLKQRSVRKEII